MNDKLFALIDSLTKGQGEMSKTPMGREVLFATDPNIGAGVPGGVDIQELLRGMTDRKSPIRSQFSSMFGRNKLQRDIGESKSIDDIINASDIAQFLSSAMIDKTNTDIPYNLRPDISKYSSDDPLDLLFKMKDDERKRPMTPNEFLRILEEARAQKPVIS
tara:strand:+ start:931 stop:1413 length:483 start_codon:yes stop_codon:yes gene_type:complete